MNHRLARSCKISLAIVGTEAILTQDVKLRMTAQRHSDHMKLFYG